MSLSTFGTGNTDDGEKSNADDISFKNLRKKLFEDCATSNLNVGEEHMKVYLRIRPFTEDENNRNENQDCLELQNENTLLAHAPPDSHTYRNCTHGLGKTTHKFTFSRIFQDKTTQKEMFNETMLGLVKDFIDGQNCLVFTYGVTSSGKTYTIQGKSKDAGILPRALDVLFNSISGKQVEGVKIKPKMFTDVKRLTPEQEVLEKKLKNKTLLLGNDEEPDVMSLLGDDASDVSQVTNTTGCSESSNISNVVHESKDSLETNGLFDDLENRIREETAVNVEDQGKIRFSIWVSFAEIYNEQIFDLLVPMPKKKNARRQVLKLGEDKHGSPYIKELKQVHVSSADEAYKLLTVGQQNLKTACTKLNHQSSRSHCIFNIKIIRVVDIDNPSVARVSMLSLCDLAGSERYSKTQSAGDRIKEAGNINTSLMTLGRCIEMLRFNQHHKDKPKIIPFRDSKLTRLFQIFFCGQGKAAMIVNASQCASMFDETLHVFKFSAIAKQVQVVQKLPPVRPLPTPVVESRSSISWATPGTMLKLNSALKTAQNVPLPEESDDELDVEDENEQLLQIIDVLHNDLKAMRKEKILMESRIRAEVCKEMGEQFVAIERACNERVKESEIMAEELMEKRIQILMEGLASQKLQEGQKQKLDCFKDDEDEWVSSLLLHQEKVKVQEKDKELDDLYKKNESMKIEIDQLKEMYEKSRSQRDHNSESGSDIGNSVILETLTQQLQESKEQAKSQEEEIEKMNEMLEEAGETFAQKDADLQSLQNTLAEREQTIQSKNETIQSLELALKETRTAVDDADRRLTKQEASFAELQVENSKLKDELSTTQGCVKFMEETVKQKEEEVRSWKSRCMRAEEDSLKQEQALINGYKAEISHLKQQISSLKSKLNKYTDEETTVLSPAKVVSESPQKRTNMEENDDFKNNLSKQLRDLQSELDKNSSAMSELQQALQISKAANEDLEKRLHQEQEAYLKADSKLAELEEKKGDIDELRLKISALENSFEDREQNLATKVEENLKAESVIKELQEKLEEAKKSVDILKSELEVKDTEIEKLEERVEELETLNTGLKDVINKVTGEVHEKEAVSEVKDTQQESIFSPGSPVKSLQKKMREMKSEIENSNKKLQKAEKDKAKMKKDMQKATKLFKEKTDNLQQCSSMCKDLEFQLDEVSVEKGELKETKDTLELKATELENIVALKDQEISELKDEINKLKDAQKVLEDDIRITEDQENEKAQKEIKDSAEKLEKEVIDLKESLKENKNQVEKTMEEFQELKTENEMLLKEIKIKDEEIQKVKEEMNGISTELQQVKEDLEKELSEKSFNILSLNTELAETKVDKEVEMTNRERIIENMNELYEKLQKELDDKCFEVKDLKHEISKITKENLSAKELGGSQETISTLQTTVQEKEVLLTESESKCKHLEKELEEKTKINIEFEAKVEKLNSDLLEKENSEKEQEKQFEDVRNELQEKKTCIENMEKKLGMLVEEKENAEKKLEIFVQEKENVEKKIEVLVQEKENLKVENENALQHLQQQISEKLCEIEAIKQSKEISDNKITEVETKLMELQVVIENKERELSEVREHYEVMQKKVSSDTTAELEQVIMQLAEAKSSLHMAQTLHQRAKTELLENTKTIEEFKEEITQLKSGKEKLTVELEESLKQTSVDKTEIQTECSRLSEELSEVRNEKEKLLEKISKFQHELDDLKQTHSLVCQEKDKIGQELNDLNCKIEEKDQQKEQIVKDNDEKLQTLCRDIEQLKVAVHTAHKELESKETLISALRTTSLESEGKLHELEKLKEELRCEKLRCEEYQKQLDDTKLQDCLSPTSQSNSVRQLRKDKIEAENTITEMKWKMESLERQLASNKDSQVLEKQTQRHTTELQDKNEELRQCRAHLTILEKKCSDLEGQLRQRSEREGMSSPCRTEQLQRSSSCLTSPTVHRELNKSQEREENLRKQLQQASTTIQKMSEKISDLEDKVNQKVKAIHEAEDTIQQLKQCSGRSTGDEAKTAGMEEEVKKQWSQIQELQHELNKKEQKLQSKTQALKELRTTLQGERDDFDTALRDARANESLIETLKNAISEQEDTMEKQDVYLQRKEEEIKDLSKELQLYMEKYRQLLETSGNSGKEMRELTKENARLMAEQHQQNKQLQEQDNMVKKLTEDKEKFTSIISENNKELKDMEKLLSDCRCEVENLKQQQESNCSESIKDIQKQHTQEVEDLKTKVRERDSSLRETHKRLRQEGEELKSIQVSITAKEEELKNVTLSLKSKQEEMQKWREERDSLVTGLESLIKKQQAEIRSLKEQNQDHDIVMDIPSRQEPIRLSKRQGRKRRSCSESDAQLPVKKECDVSFNSEDNSVSEHVQIDATPPVAARNLRKSRKKYSSVIDLKEVKQMDKENCGPKKCSRTRGPESGTQRVGSFVSRIKNSSLKRSAKRLLDGIADMASPKSSTPDKSDSMIEVEDHGTQITPQEPVEHKKSRRCRKKHQLYKEELQISEPISVCSPVVQSPTEDVHNIVQRKLRSRRH